MFHKYVLSACFLSVFASGCAISPFEGETVDSNDSVIAEGGSPVAGTPILVYCEYVVHPGTGNGYKFVTYANAESTLREQAELYGDFYYWSTNVVVPEECWHADGHANLWFRAAHNSKWYGVYTYDDNLSACLPDTTPLTGNDWASCAQNSTGHVTVCRSGTTWDGSSCN